MSQETRAIITTSLMELVAEKRRHLDMLAMSNTATDEAQRMQQSAAYRQAQSDLFYAEAALRDEFPAPTNPYAD